MKTTSEGKVREAGVNRYGVSTAQSRNAVEKESTRRSLQQLNTALHANATTLALGDGDGPPPMPAPIKSPKTEEERQRRAGTKKQAARKAARDAYAIAVVDAAVARANLLELGLDPDDDAPASSGPPSSERPSKMTSRSVHRLRGHS